MDFADPVAPASGLDYWEFRSQDGRIVKRIQLPAGRDVAVAHYQTAPDVGTLYIRNGLGPNQLDIMFNGTVNVQRRTNATYGGIANTQGGEAYLVRGSDTEINTGAIASAGWDNRELPMIEVFEASNAGGATNFTLAVAFSEGSANDADADGASNEAESLAGTDPFHADSDRDGMPDGWELDNGLNPLSDEDAGFDGDGDDMTNHEEYLTGTNPGDSNSDFSLTGMAMADQRILISYLAQSGVHYQIYLADSVTNGGWNWRTFNNTNIPYGSYRHAGAAAYQSFTDDFSAETSGMVPTGGMRVYYIEALRD
jgi:hypothetical protein